MDHENENEIPPGFRFYPTEEELVSFYLPKKLDGHRPDLNRVIPVIDIYELEPWHLPKKAGELCSGDTEQWFFFVPRREREALGGRPNRTTASGYWKATGSPNYVYSSENKVIGLKKTMVFYGGKAPTGKKTKWKMNEYRAIKEETDNPYSFGVPKVRHELSLCRVYVVSGSVRAFDRRPLGSEIREANRSNYGNLASSSQKAVLKMEKTATSSLESSYMNENTVDHLVEDVGTSSSDILANDGFGPQFEWEQLLGGSV